MRRVALLPLLLTLVVSLAAPAGAVFALEGVVSADEITPTEKVENTPEEDIEAPLTKSIPHDDPPADAPPILHVPVLLPESELPEESDAEELPPATLADSVIITEIRTRGSSNASAELVEVYNAGAEAVDITGWCLQYAAAGIDSSYRNSLCIASSDGVASTRVIMPAGAHAVFVSSALVAAAPGFLHDGLLGSAMADSGGRLKLIDATGEAVDLVGWGTASEYQGAGQAPAVTATLPQRSLQRITVDGHYQNTPDNFSDFVLAEMKAAYETGALYEVTDVCANMSGIQEVAPDGFIVNSRGECVDRLTINFCEGVVINEIAANVTRQYIELANTSEFDVPLDGCRLLTNRSASTYASLDGVTLDPGAYHVIFIEDTALKLTKSTTGTVYLLASDGETETDAVSYEDLSSDTSWALFPDSWKQTYELTPGAPNVYMQFAACPAGQERSLETGRCRNIAVSVAATDCGEGRERNPATGRCRNIPTAKELAPCREGQYRSEETNRCRSIASAASILKPCADDQFRNPATNRCKKIASAEDIALADCGEGRERNPETNRCRNVLSASTLADTLPFPVEKTEQSGESFAGWWTLGLIAAAGILYGIWEWRYELGEMRRRLLRFISRSE